MARPADEPVEAPGQAGDRRGDDADELAVKDLARRELGDRGDLLGVERLAVHEAALERQQLAAWPSAKSAIALAAAAASPRTNVSAVGPSSSAFSASAPACVGRALGQRVLDDAERRVGVAQLRRAARPTCGDGDAAVVDGEDRLGLLDLIGDLSDRRSFLLSVHRPPRRACPRVCARAAGGLRMASKVSVSYAAAAAVARLLEDVAGTGRVDLDARAHGRGEGDRAQVAALGRRGLGADELLDDGGVVLQQLALVEARLADRQVDDRGAVGAVLDLAGLGLLDRLGDVHRHRADLRVGHLALRAEDAAEAADDRHHVRRRDRDVEVGEALLDALGEVLGADDVGAGLLGLVGLVALGEDGDVDVLAEAVGQRDRAAQLLVGVADVQAGAHVDLDGLVELRALELLDQRDRLGGRVLALAVDLRRASM